MTNRVESVTIVGGGTAGWLTAIMLSTFMNGRRDGPPIAITLIESPNVPTVGVGEATVPGMARLLMQLGIDEAEFFRRCNASFKCGVRFVGWNAHPDGRKRDFIHPFNPATPIDGGHNPAYHFHKFARPLGATDIVDGLVPNVALIDHHKGPREPHRANYEQAIGYSYHLDAALFAGFLRDLCIERGIRHVRDDVTDVALDERGHVASLTLAQGGAHPVELVVDCTGFRGLIIGDALDEPFEPWDRHLLCDRALALQVEHVPGTPLEVCTTATALGAGWVWNVPLFTRVGTGYVFSSAHRSDSEAWDEFRQHLTGKGFRADDPPRAIAMRLGRRRRAWVKNCVAVGLAGGFIEPLEATAIFTIEMTVRHLVHHFPDRAISPAPRARFNRLVRDLTDNILEFITMHYATADRADPFWRAARSDINLPDGLAENLALWKHTLPGPADNPGNVLFDYWSYIFCLYAKGYFDDVEFPAEGSVARADWEAYVRDLDRGKAALIRHMPDHRDLVRRIRGEPSMAPAFTAPGAATLRPVISGLPGRGV